jgi:hypothetical protein
MSDFMDRYFGPLSKDSCVYFLFIAMIFFALMVFALVADIFWIFKNYTMLNIRVFTGGLLLLFNLFVAYFFYRLLYTMCTKSL